MMIIFLLMLGLILLILVAYALYIKYITKITELENRIDLYEGIINELNNEITELKKGNKGWTFEKKNRWLDFTFT